MNRFVIVVVSLISAPVVCLMTPAVLLLKCTNCECYSEHHLSCCSNAAMVFHLILLMSICVYIRITTFWLKFIASCLLPELLNGPSQNAF